MDIKLVSQLKEADIFVPVNDKEISRRQATRPPFVCPRCKKPITSVDAKRAEETTAELFPSGEVNLESLEWSSEEPFIEFYCPECHEDITGTVAG